MGKDIVESNTDTTDPVPLNVFRLESGFVFGSDLNHGGGFGKQYEVQNEFEYGRRIQSAGNCYLHLGVSYARYDFASTSAPVPDHLQSSAAVLGVDYMHGRFGLTYTVSEAVSVDAATGYSLQRRFDFGRW